MRKTILVGVVCAVLALCLSLSAFAAGTPEAAYNGESEQQDVKITINGELVHTYLVDIEFSNPVFTYSSGSVWDPENYIYKPNSAAEWAGEGTVKIINHSDLSVNYLVEAETVVSTFGPLDIAVTGGTGILDKCEVGTVYGSKNATATFTVTGTPTVSEITAQKLGEIKVTISK